MRNKKKRILSILCAFSLFAVSILGTFPAKEIEAAGNEAVVPVSLRGYENVTISDYGIEGTHQGTKDSNIAIQNGMTSMDKSLLSMRIKYETGGINTRFHIGYIKSVSSGLGIYISADGSEMYLRTFNDNHVTVTKGYLATYKASDAGLSTFLNNEFLLQISFEYGDFDEDAADTAANDVKLGFYFNGKLYQNAVTQINNCNVEKIGTGWQWQLNASDAKLELHSVVIRDVEPVSLEGYKNVTISDYGIEGTHQGTKDSNVAIQNGMTSMDKSLLSMRIKYETGGINTRFHIGYIKSVSSGLGIYISADGSEMYLRTFNDNHVTVTKGYLATYKASDAGLSTFLNNEFLLQISFEYGDFDEDATDTAANDVKIGFYFNGKLYQNAVTQINNCNVEKIGTGWQWQLNASDAKLELHSVVIEDVEPVSLEGYKNVTISDYGIEGTHQGTKDSNVAIQNGMTSMDKSLLSMRIKYETGGINTRFHIGYIKSVSSGLGIYISADGSEMYLRTFNDNHVTTTKGTYATYKASDAGLSTFLNNEFLLQISFEYGDFDEDAADTAANDVKLGFYFNGKLYQNAATQINNCNVEKIGTGWQWQLNAADAKLYLESVVIGNGEGPAPVIPPEELDPDLTEITFGDYGIRNGTYTYNPSGKTYDLSTEGYYHGESMDGTVFHGKVFFSEVTKVTLTYAGKQSAWHGLRFSNDENGNLVLSNMTGFYGGSFSKNTAYTFTSDKVGIPLVGKAFDLKLSIQYVELDEDDLKNDVKLGVWFEDVLYDNQYIYLTDLAEYLGYNLGVYCETKDASLTVESVGETELGLQPEEGLTRISFASYGIKDGEYHINLDGKPFELSAEGKYRGKDYDGTLFEGNVLYSDETTATICFAGKKSAWHGLRLSNTEDGNLVLNNLTGNNSSFKKKVFSSQKAGIQLVGRKVNLKMSMQYVDQDGDGINDDVKLGVWFDNVLYGNQYIYLEGVADYLGCNMSIYCETDAATLAVESYEGAVLVREQPNENFQKITFSHFGVADGTYAYTNTTTMTLTGRLDGIESLDETVLCGDIFLSKGGNFSMAIGGQNDPWLGMRITVGVDGVWKLGFIGKQSKSGTVATFKPGIAQTELTGKWLNIMISTEILDADQDGAEDDLKVGFWFDGKLYREEYNIILNMAPELGEYFGVYCANEGATISVRSIPEFMADFNYSRYGLDRNWSKTLLDTGMKGREMVGGSTDAAPFTGNWDVLLRPIILVGFAISIMLCSYIIRKRKRG